MTPGLFALALTLLPARALAPSPSVLLVTLDTFRGDHIGTEEETPHLRRLAASGVQFTRARSPIPLTLPSHASLLTGLYPPEHGVRDNGAFVLAERHRTLTEALREAGYETAAFVGSFVLDRRFGLARGFDLYDDRVQSELASLESPEAERPGNEVVEAFETWLRSRPATRPFFAWVHLYDPHAPYEPPPPYPPTYAGEIAFTDALVGRLLESLPDADATLVAVVGDHGEGLGEHEEQTHALFVYNATLHVPLILSGPGVPAGREVSALVRTIDVPATLLELLGQTPSFGRGESLRALFAETSPGASRRAYSESLYGPRHFGFAPLHGLETDRYHYIDAPRQELYDLQTDPGEVRDTAPSSAAASRLAEELDALREELGDADADADAGAASALDEETRARLESLGYVTAAPSASTRPDALDPKDGIEIYERVRLAQAHRARGRCDSAIETLTPIVAELSYPVAVAYETLGGCLLDEGRLSEARRLYDEALARGLDEARFHIDLGVVAYREGELGRSERELRSALEREPWNVRAHYHLGNVLRAERRDAEAAAAYEEAVRLNPRYVFAWNGLGMTRSRRGEEDAALEAFRRVVAVQPEEPRGHFNLAVQLERMGRREEALPVYRHFLSIAPERTFARERARALAATR